jgi:hypothetical protein
MSKTCGDCRYFKNGKCYFNNTQVCAESVHPCWYFKPKQSNGDKIIAGGMRAIAELGLVNKCARCIYSTYEEDVGFGEAGWTCNCPKDKACVDGIEAWLNAPAESEGEDEEKLFLAETILHIEAELDFNPDTKKGGRG